MGEQNLELEAQRLSDSDEVLAEKLFSRLKRIYSNTGSLEDVVSEAKEFCRKNKTENQEK